jgi:translation initiation factor IF-2
LAPQRRDSLLPARSGIKVIDTKTKRGAVDPNKKKDGDGSSGGSKPPERRGAVVRFAELPNVKQPTGPVRSNEPAPQKPVLRLPTDAIAGARKGSGAAPLQALTKKMEAERAKSTTDAGKRGIGKGAPVSPADLSSSKPIRGGQKARPGVPGEEAGLGDMASLRAGREKARKTVKPRGFRDDDDGGRSRRRRSLVRSRAHGSTAAPRKGKVELELPCTVRSFSEAAGVSAPQVMKVLMGMNIMANINAPIPDEYVELIAAELGVELDFKQPESLEEQALAGFDDNAEDEAALEPRPPIVTVLGHVDHGKTSLLDKIIGLNVVSGEAGGITQHIRAYLIETKDGRHVSFVDTPGHEAFTEMRARGANVTDIAVLVVAADDGVMPQTEEAISHAKAAEVPIVVAMNKIDLPGADEQKVLQQLATAGLLPSEWGGDVEVIRTSAMTGQGIDTLLETLLVTAELHDYKANPARPASGMCLEAEQEGNRGVIA